MPTYRKAKTRLSPPLDGVQGVLNAAEYAETIDGPTGEEIGRVRLHVAARGQSTPTWIEPDDPDSWAVIRAASGETADAHPLTVSRGLNALCPMPITISRGPVPIIISLGGDLDDEKYAPTERDLLADIARSPRLVISTAGAAFAVLDGVAVAISDEQFPDWIGAEYYRRTGHPTGSPFAIKNAVDIARAEARARNERVHVVVRIGAIESATIIDIGDHTYEAIVVDATDWRICKLNEIDIRDRDGLPILFRRPPGMLPLARPTRGGSIDAFAAAVNTKSADDLAMILVWIVGVIRGCGPRFHLSIVGEQGSCKTTLARELSALIDPQVGAMRGAPKNDRDTMIAASNAYALFFDNLSKVDPWFSDLACRLATAGGMRVKKLYSDAAEQIFEAQTPLVFTSIEPVVKRSDLADRTLVVALEPINDEERKRERDVQTRFADTRPAVFGALLTAVAHGIANEANVSLRRSPRMADHVRFAIAAAPKLGLEPDSVLAALERNREESGGAALESFAIVQPMRALVAQLRVQYPGSLWRGSATDLLAVLRSLAAAETLKLPDWPGRAEDLSGLLRRAAPGLRREGADIRFTRSDGRRFVTISVDGAK